MSDDLASVGHWLAQSCPKLDAHDQIRLAGAINQVVGALPREAVLSRAHAHRVSHRYDLLLTAYAAACAIVRHALAKPSRPVPVRLVERWRAADDAHQRERGAA